MISLQENFMFLKNQKEKSKELHLSIEVKQSATQLDNSSAFRIVKSFNSTLIVFDFHRFFPEFFFLFPLRFTFYVNGTDEAVDCL